MNTTPLFLPQLLLPGQAHAAEGPHDHAGMYVMHFGLRRDLANFASAVAATPLGDESTWRALRDRWQFFAAVLHHHHTVEDEHYWPILAAAVRDRGTAADQALIDDMEGEHAAIDPALTACGQAFEAVLDHPCDAHRNALDLRMAALREAIDEHLSHEERETLPLVQRMLTAAEYARVEKAVERAYPLRMVPALLPWSAHHLPAEAADRAFGPAGPVYRLVLRLTRPRFERRECAAFRYSESVLPR